MFPLMLRGAGGMLHFEHSLCHWPLFCTATHFPVSYASTAKAASARLRQQQHDDAFRRCHHSRRGLPQQPRRLGQHGIASTTRARSQRKTRTARDRLCSSLLGLNRVVQGLGFGSRWSCNIFVARQGRNAACSRLDVYRLLFFSVSKREKGVGGGFDGWGN